MNKKIKISVVKYTNTLPFRFGLTNSQENDRLWSLQFDTPADCASQLLNDSVDIGLVPVAILPLVKEPQIISNYCLACNGKVDTVKLYSRVPLDKITTVLLDYQSRTSVNLVQILAKFYWKINPEFKNATEGFEDNIQCQTAALIIGDRCFSHNGNYQYEFDLGEQWLQFTGLPFVFALWVANKKIQEPILVAFENALSYGLRQLPLAISQQIQEDMRDKITSYLTRNIVFQYDRKMEQSFRHFLDLLKKLNHA